MRNFLSVSLHFITVFSKFFLSEIKSNDFLAKTKSGEDFFHLAVAVTQFGDRPSPEMSMSDLMVATRELKKTAKGI